MSNPFKQGDTAICIDPTCLLEKGKKYSVIKSDGQGIWVVNENDAVCKVPKSTFYTCDRFEKDSGNNLVLSDDQKFLIVEANKILCADISNGIRDYWLFDFSEDRMQQLAKSSVQLVRLLIQESKK